MAARIPALVVSGFLGSGKTTLVRRLLSDAQARGVRAAVISNEFGALGIDQALFGPGGDAYVELEGGCVCCKLSDELQLTLQRLWEQLRPDQVIVETSGVALPFETQLTFWRPPVSEWVGDDAAVVVVNAGQVWEGRDLEGTFEHQVSAADLVLLNQIDTLPPGGLPRVLAMLRQMSPGTPILETSYAEVSPELLFPPDPDDWRERRRLAPPSARPHTHEAFVSEVIEVPPGLSLPELESSLRSHRALRTKGFVQTADGPRLVQGVGRRLELIPSPVAVPPELLGKVVVITRGEGAHPHE